MDQDCQSPHAIQRDADKQPAAQMCWSAHNRAKQRLGGALMAQREGDGALVVPGCGSGYRRR